MKHDTMQATTPANSLPAFCALFVLGAILLASFGASPAIAQDGLCARVRIELEQRVTITRNAFRATFTMINDTDETLTNIGVPIVIRDADGLIANDRFFIEEPQLTVLTGVDGDGTLGPGQTGTAVWIIIPLDDAAPTGPEMYGFGGSMSYLSQAGQSGADFTPVELEVLPNPRLRLKYFWERNVYSDDPFTPEIEPAVPFTIGMMMINDGFGVANNVRIETSQPEIIENERGLLIDFELIGTRVGEANLISPLLNITLGDLGPGAISVAAWYMITSLQGQFVNYEARFEHLDAIGQPRVFDPRLSLIESVEIFECIRPVLSLEPGDDSILDFMTNEQFYPEDPYEDPSNPELRDLPDTLHLSDGRVEPVTPVLDASVTVLSEGVVRINASMPNGWTYIMTPDPFGGAFRLARARRQDGRELPLVTNAWLTDRTFRTGQSALRNARIHLFDKGGSGSYTLEFVPRDGEPGIAAWRSVASHGLDLPHVGIDLFPGPPTSESRLGGIEALAIDFNTPVDPSTVLPFTVDVVGTGLDGQPISIDLAGLEFTPGQTNTSAVIRFDQPLTTPGVYCITITGITDPFGQVLTQNRRLIVSVLPGDVTSDRRVNNTDIGAIASLAGLESISPGESRHVRADFNRDGRVDDADLTAVLALRGSDARFIPAPCIARDVNTNGDFAVAGRGGTVERSEEEITLGIGSGPIGAFADPQLLAELERGVSPESLGLGVIDASFLGNGETLYVELSLLAVRMPRDQYGTDETTRLLAEFGLDPESLTPWPMEGWWVGRISVNIEREEILENLADLGVFTSPVLFGADGGYTIPTESLLVVTDSPLETFASALGIGESFVSPGPAGLLWTVTPHIQNGDEMLTFALRAATIESILAAEPDMILSAALPIGAALPVSPAHTSDSAALLLPELSTIPGPIIYASGDRLDWPALLTVPIDDPSPYMLGRASEGRLLPHGTNAGAIDRRIARLIRGIGGNPAIVTRLSWLHAALAASGHGEVTIAVSTSAYGSSTISAADFGIDRLLVGQSADLLLGRRANLLATNDENAPGLYVPSAESPAMAAIDAGIAAVWLRRTGHGGVAGSIGIPDTLYNAPLTPEAVMGVVADWDGDGIRTSLDIVAFIDAFVSGDSRADLDLNGLFDLNDITMFGHMYNR